MEGDPDYSTHTKGTKEYDIPDRVALPTDRDICGDDVRR